MHEAGALSAVLLHVAFVELSVREENFDNAVLELPAFEPGLDDFTWGTVQDALPLGFSFAPLSLVDGSVLESADSRSVPQIVLPVALVNVTIRKDHLSLAVLEALRDPTVVDIARDLVQLVKGVLDELVPVKGYSLGEDFWDFKLGLSSEFVYSVLLLFELLVFELFQGSQSRVRLMNFWAFEVRVGNIGVGSSQYGIVANSSAFETLSKGAKGRLAALSLPL